MGDPNNGHGIDGKVRNGELKFYIRSTNEDLQVKHAALLDKKPEDLKGGALFSMMMAHFKNQGTEINRIRAEWWNDDEIGDNFKAYKAALENVDEVTAALNHTFTGYMAKKNGFNNVEIVFDTDDYVEIIFLK